MGKNTFGIQLLKQIPPLEQVAYADAFSWQNFDNGDDSDRVCIILNNIHFFATWNCNPVWDQNLAGNESCFWRCH